jgi:hypothetical protein
MIASEEHDDHPRTTFIMRSGTRTREDVTESGKGIEQWIRKENYSMPIFNP